jgi:transcriptional regulator with XRE-family HTH domain
VDIINNTMNIGDKIKKVREAKGFTQKQVAIMLEMDQSQYSKIENGKTDPTTSTLEKITKSLGIEVSELFASDDIFKDVNSADKTLMEKIRLLEQLDDKERVSIYNIVDGLFAKKKMKDTLSSAINMAS